MAERSRIIKKSSWSQSCTTKLSFKHAKPSQSNTVPTHSQGFLLPGNRTGPASAAMAWRLWKVEPIRSQSFVPIFGAFGPNERWWMRPPDLLTMKRWSGAILLRVAHLAALLWDEVRTGCEPRESSSWFVVSVMMSPRAGGGG